MGRSQLFPEKQASYFNDTTVSLFTAILLFLIPTNWKKKEFLLDWKTASEEISWDTVLLFGGGFAMAQAMTTSGLGNYLGQSISALKGQNIIILIIASGLLIKVLTELISNTAVATMLLPVVGSMAAGVGEHPFLLMIPATMMASFAFMFPVGTPPNAVVFGSGWVKMGLMAKIGLFLNLVTVVLLPFVCYILMNLFMGIEAGALPIWATATTP